jgi:hypothetical protein
MESSYQLKLSYRQQELLNKGISTELLTEVIGEHADQLAYMLQAYYPREKVSKVKVIPEAVVLKDSATAVLDLKYVIEEFSACSAIDTEQKDKMTVTVTVCPETGVLNLKGEVWPEL